MENKKMNENKLYKEDVIRIVLIFVVALGAVIGTWIMVKYKHDEKNKAIVTNYLKIDNNDLYTYQNVDTIIKFYDKDSKIVSSYTCTSKCDVASSSNYDFNFDSKEIVAINDKNRFILFDVANNDVAYVYDDKPIKFEGGKYGIVQKNGKYGLINSKLEVIIKNEYDLIDEAEGFIITVSDNLLNILDSSFNNVINDPIEIDDYSLIQSSLDGSMMTIRVTSIDGKKTSFKLKVA